jgi:S-formylglutathione hydrolase FrmB
MKFFYTVLLLLMAGSAFAQGTLINDTLFSAALNTRKLADVYLPAGYDDSSTRYPVIYFLHGMGENQDSYGPMIPVLDNLIANNLMRPTIVVKPDGSCPPFEGSMYSNSALYGRYEDFIAQDLVEYIDSHYRTIADRNARAIMGHSMGGYGCMKLALKHPATYRGVAAMAGWMSLEPWDYWHQHLLAENSGHGPYLPERGFFSVATYSAAGAFSPNPSLPPYFVNFPIDSAGAIVDSVYLRWQHEMPDWFAQQNTDLQNLAIYFDCGTEDELGFYDQTVTFDSVLTAEEIPHRFLPVPGGHEDNLIARGIVALTFLDSVMRAASDVSDVLSRTPSLFTLSQNYPNPFNSRTDISFALPNSQDVSLKIFDALGRDVRTLISGRVSAGEQHLSFDAAGLPSGIYFYQLRTGMGTQTRKMLLLR